MIFILQMIKSHRLTLEEVPESYLETRISILTSFLTAKVPNTKLSQFYCTGTSSNNNSSHNTTFTSIQKNTINNRSCHGYFYFRNT